MKVVGAMDGGESARGSIVVPGQLTVELEMCSGRKVRLSMTGGSFREFVQMIDSGAGGGFLMTAEGAVNVGLVEVVRLVGEDVKADGGGDKSKIVMV